MKVLCDHMLGSLAVWLRIFGVDTAYPALDSTDEAILAQAKAEGRMLLTRDKKLSSRAQRQGVHAVYLPSTDLDDQLRTVVPMIGIDSKLLLTRCTQCNAVLASLEKDNAAGLVPPKVFATQERFWVCPVCQRLYWEGTHAADMRKRIAALVEHTTED